MNFLVYREDSNGVYVYHHCNRDYHEQSLDRSESIVTADCPFKAINQAFALDENYRIVEWQFQAHESSENIKVYRWLNRIEDGRRSSFLGVKTYVKIIR